MATDVKEPAAPEVGGEGEEGGPLTIGDLVDLALATPEIGTVNFKILRILLHSICDKLGIDNLPVALGDDEQEQIEVKFA